MTVNYTRHFDVSSIAGAQSETRSPLFFSVTSQVVCAATTKKSPDQGNCFEFPLLIRGFLARASHRNDSNLYRHFDVSSVA